MSALTLNRSERFIFGLRVTFVEIRTIFAFFSVGVVFLLEKFLIFIVVGIWFRSIVISGVIGAILYRESFEFEGSWVFNSSVSVWLISLVASRIAIFILNFLLY